MDTVILPDGYSGGKVTCYVEPIETDGNMLKLRVVGSDYLFRWTTKTLLKIALEKQEQEAYKAMENEAYAALESEYQSSMRDWARDEEIREEMRREVFGEIN